MSIFRRLRHLITLFGALFQAISSLPKEFREAGKWERAAMVAATVGVFALAIFTPPRRAPPQRVLIPWDQMRPLDQQGEALALCITLLMMAGILYFLKLRQRFLYGVLEIAVAMVACWKWYFPQGRTVPVMLREGTLSDVVAASTIIYIMVRGLDNCYEYIKAKRLKKEKQNGIGTAA